MANRTKSSLREPNGSGSGLIGALHVPAPPAELEDKLMAFGQFVGSWDLRNIRKDSNGNKVEMTGELHFGWVLGGRAVQDIWIVPRRGEPGEGHPPQAFHGSTIRFYDPKIEAWRSTWVEPVNGRVRRFIGRITNSDIVLLSDEDSPQLRWSFTEIQSNSFTWIGEISEDGGSTWKVEEIMYAVRRHLE